jgi:hypothetical protein
MPQVKFETAKGLYQKAGKGIRFQATKENQVAPTNILIGKDGLTTGVDPYQESATQLFPLGSTLHYGDRTFKYVKMDGAVTKGKLIASSVYLSTTHNKAISNLDAGTLAAIDFTNGTSAVAKSFSHAVGSRAIAFGNLGVDVAKDDFAEGYILITDAAGEGQLLRIRTHEPCDISGASSRTDVVIETYDPLTTAITKNASEASLIKHPCMDVVVAPHGVLTPVIGATVIDMSDDYFGWIVCKGPAAVLTSGTIVLGQIVCRANDSTAGACEAAGNDLEQDVGVVRLVGATAEYSIVDLNL